MSVCCESLVVNPSQLSAQQGMRRLFRPQAPLATVLTGVWPPNPIFAFPGLSVQLSELPAEGGRTLPPQRETARTHACSGTLSKESLDGS